MRIINIPRFDITPDQCFYGARLYEQDGQGILFERNGHILQAGSNLTAELIQGTVPDELRSKLFQRGFLGDKKNGRRFTAQKDIIRPEFFMIDLTNRCNMRCGYCLRKIDDKGESLSNHILRDICLYIQEYCNSQKLLHVSIQAWGGEPLLEMDRIEQIRRLLRPEKTKVHISVETNGVLLTEGNRKRLYENKIGIGISIDGGESFHNAQRVFPDGSGTYDLVAGQLRNALHSYGERLGTITTITRKNADNIEEILEHLAIDLGLSHVKFNYVHESVFSDCKDYCLTQSEIVKTEQRLLEKIVSLCEQGRPIIEHHIQVKLKNLLFREYSDICHSCGCCGGKRMIVFDRAGGIFPCELTDFPEYQIGSIYDGIPLLNIIQNAVSQRSFFIDKKKEDCKDCDWYCFCRGGCTVRVLSKGTTPPDVDQIECAVNSILYPALMQLILEKPAVVNMLVGRTVLDV